MVFLIVKWDNTCEASTTVPGTQYVLWECQMLWLLVLEVKYSEFKVPSIQVVRIRATVYKATFIP